MVFDQTSGVRRTPAPPPVIETPPVSGRFRSPLPLRVSGGAKVPGSSVSTLPSNDAAVVDADRMALNTSRAAACVLVGAVESIPRRAVGVQRQQGTPSEAAYVWYIEAPGFRGFDKNKQPYFFFFAVETSSIVYNLSLRKALPGMSLHPPPCWACLSYIIRSKTSVPFAHSNALCALDVPLAVQLIRLSNKTLVLARSPNASPGGRRRRREKRRSTSWHLRTRVVGELAHTRTNTRTVVDLGNEHTKSTTGETYRVRFTTTAPSGRRSPAVLGATPRQSFAVANCYIFRFVDSLQKHRSHYAFDGVPTSNDRHRQDQQKSLTNPERSGAVLRASQAAAPAPAHSRAYAHQRSASSRPSSPPASKQVGR